METKHLLLAFFIALSLHSVAQQIPNAGFEDWSNYRVNEPDGYYPFNSRADSGNGNVTKVLDAYHGTFAARLETVLSNNDTVQGMMIIGRPGNQTIDGGIPFIGTPDSIIGYVKYDIKPTDLANIIILFKKNGTVIAQAATTFTGTQTTYQRFSIPIHLAGLIPDTLAAVFSSSNMDSPRIIGSTMTIDNVSFVNSAQQFPNGDFENWTAINPGQNPIGWSSYNDFYNYGIPEMSFQTTDAHSGSSALRLISVSTTTPPPFGTNTLDTLAGIVVLGNINSNNSGIPYAFRPTSMEAYVKGTVIPVSEAYLMATLSKWNSTTHVRDQVGMAMYYTSSSTANYTQISVPFNYSLSYIPDTIDLKIMAGNMGPGSKIMPGNEFFVDDISFTFSASGINDLKMDPLNIRVFPNPATEKVMISSLEKIDTIELLNLLGKKVYSVNCFGKQTSTEIELRNYPRGIYMVKVNDGKKIYTTTIVLR